MLSPALIKLLRLQLNARVRWMMRGGRRGRTIMFFVVGIALMLGWLLPVVIARSMHGRSDPGKVRVYLPALLLTICIANLVTSAGERAIAFTPAESDFLFPGPFTRRELLLYKIVKGTGAAFMSALLFGTWAWSIAPAWVISFLACFLAIMFLQLLCMAIMLGALSVTERAQSRVKRAAMAVVLIAIAFSISPIIATARTYGQYQIAQGLQNSKVVKLLLMPFDVFGRIVAASSLHAAWPWIGVALAMVLACVIAVLALDAHYLDAAAAAGRRRYELVQRARTRGTMIRATNSRLRAPQLPRMGGVGPIAWRQLTTALRQSRGLLTLLLMIGVGAGIFVFVQGEAGQPLRPTGNVIGWATIMLSNSLRLDFRGDVDLIDTLKALPLAPVTICAGEIIAPAVLMSLFHFAVLIMALIAAPNMSPYLLAIAILIVPANLILFAVENLTFLLFPTRYASSGPGDFQGSGRTVMVMFLKLIVFTIVVGIAAGIGAIVHLLSHSMPLSIGVVILVMLAELSALIALMAIAFRRFDPQVHTPV